MQKDVKLSIVLQQSILAMSLDIIDLSKVKA